MGGSLQQLCRTQRMERIRGTVAEAVLRGNRESVFRQQRWLWGASSNRMRVTTRRSSTRTLAALNGRNGVVMPWRRPCAVRLGLRAVAAAMTRLAQRVRADEVSARGMLAARGVYIMRERMHGAPPDAGVRQGRWIASCSCATCAPPPFEAPSNVATAAV